MVLCSAWFCSSINTFCSLVLFAVVIHKRRGKKLISKPIKHKLDSSSKIQFAFFIIKTFKIFLKNHRFCQKSGNDANSKEWGDHGHGPCVIMTQCVQKSICDSPVITRVIFKVNNKNTRKTSVMLFLLFLQLTLRILHTFIYCFYCLIWTSKCKLGRFSFLTK